MLPAVEFDDEPLLDADKVDDVVANPNLTAELKPLEPPIPHGIPKLDFAVGAVSAKRACAADGIVHGVQCGECTCR